MRVPKLPHIPRKVVPLLVALVVAGLGTATLLLTQAEPTTNPTLPDPSDAQVGGGESIEEMLAKKKAAKPQQKKSEPAPPPTTGKRLVWQEDFSGGSVSGRYWNVATAAQPIYNNEAQKYSSSSSNVRVAGGMLILEARQSGSSYTSGRIDTMGKMKVKVNSRLEARIKSTKGKGTWPAFWLLSDNQPYTTKQNPTDAMWEQERFYMWDGEIDIMEAYGYHPGQVESTVYTYARDQEKTSPVSNMSGSFHTYWLEWRSDKLVFGVDGTAYHTFTKGNGSTQDWPYTSANQMYIILNVAMGGTGGGQIVKAAGDKWTMEVDWIKYYSL